jgi:ubiquinone biosynthesis protein Coq4
MNSQNVQANEKTSYYVVSMAFTFIANKKDFNHVMILTSTECENFKLQNALSRFETDILITHLVKFETKFYPEILHLDVLKKYIIFLPVS